MLFAREYIHIRNAMNVQCQWNPPQGRAPRPFPLYKVLLMRKPLLAEQLPEGLDMKNSSLSESFTLYTGQ